MNLNQKVYSFYINRLLYSRNLDWNVLIEAKNKRDGSQLGVFEEHNKTSDLKTPKNVREYINEFLNGITTIELIETIATLSTPIQENLHNISNNVYARYLWTGMRKTVFALTFYRTDGTPITVCLKTERSKKDSKSFTVKLFHEYEYQKKYFEHGIRVPLLGPIYNINGRNSYLEQYIYGRTPHSLALRGQLCDRFRAAIVRFVVDGMSRMGEFTIDLNLGNFKLRNKSENSETLNPDDYEVVLIDPLRNKSIYPEDILYELHRFYGYEIGSEENHFFYETLSNIFKEKEYSKGLQGLKRMLRKLQSENEEHFEIELEIAELYFDENLI